MFFCHVPLISGGCAALCEELIANPDSRETLDTLAEQQATSSRTLTRQFQRETGMSFRQWRQQARLVEALGHLASGVSVALVAERLGYRSASAFTAMFKRALGLEPRRYFAGEGGAITDAASPLQAVRDSQSVG